MTFFSTFNKPKHPVAVVIPVYREEVTLYERIALEQCLKVLKNYPTFLVAPDGLSLEVYSPRTNCPTITFPRQYFTSIREYNQLMLSPEFYRRFFEFKYILIYQLDSFVFSDQFSNWCESSYDYVGAPWLGLNRREDVKGLLPLWERRNALRNLLNLKISNVGNGGFSLRKVRTFFRLSILLKGVTKTWPLNEDTFWSFAAPCYYPFFKKPGVRRAMSFAFELNPREAFKLNQNRLPFGCHAWWKYDFSFWEQRIRSLGYSL